MDYDTMTTVQLEAIRAEISKQKVVIISTLSELLDRDNHILDAIMKKSNTVPDNIEQSV